MKVGCNLLILVRPEGIEPATLSIEETLTPVVEAMEDEDPVVRSKAAPIVELHMDLEKEQE